MLNGPGLGCEGNKLKLGMKKPDKPAETNSSQQKVDTHKHTHIHNIVRASVGRTSSTLVGKLETAKCRVLNRRETEPWPGEPERGEGRGDEQYTRSLQLLLLLPVAMPSQTATQFADGIYNFGYT